MRSRSTEINTIRPLQWRGSVDGFLELIDQTKLPGELVTIACRDVETLWEAIRSLRVRGAPAIGCAAAYGVVLGARASERGDLLQAVGQTCKRLGEARPTAVNLFWALNRMQARARDLASHSANDALKALLEEAHAIRNEDAAMSRAIGRA